MSFFGFYALSGAWLFALLAPLVAFYFLKLKRPKLEIPSLVLWRQALTDQRVNSPFQRFKRNILLFLQIALLALVVLAAMQPFWRGQSTRVRRLPILIDCSAGMAALDKPGGVSRLDAAKAEAEKLVDGMLPDQELCLISFSRTARKRTSFTNDKRVLREALAGIAVEDVSSDIEDALRMTQALARSESFDEVLLLSAGNFPAQTHFELSFALRYRRLPPAGPNIGITALSARRSEDGNWDVFVNIEGSPQAEGTTAVELVQDDKVVQEETLSLAKGKVERMLFRVSGEKASQVQVRLRPDGFDSLASDNVAYIELPAVRPLWVYCPVSLATYRHALSAVSGIRLFPQTGAETAETNFDLVVTDRPEDLGLQARTWLTVGLIPEDLRRLLTMRKEGGAVVDWQRSAELLQHVELSDLLTLEQVQSNDGVRESDYDNLGYEILVHGRGGPLLLEKRSREKTSFHLLFHTDRSTLPYRVGFPIMVSNLVRLALFDAGLAEAQAQRTGVLRAPPLSPDRTYVVKGPDGSSADDKTDAAGNLAGISAPRVGIYRVLDGGSERARLGASLLSSNTTLLTSTDQIQFNENLSVAASVTATKSDRSLWKYPALLAFGVLLVEWWYFNRRIKGAAR
ncbi:MAG: vWA domain-containing protein [Candidatus Brocadiia bacterium]